MGTHNTGNKSELWKRPKSREARSSQLSQPTTMMGQVDDVPMLLPKARRHSSPPLSNGSCRSVDDLIEESIILHDEKQRRMTRQYLALAAVFLVVASVASLGVAFVALATRPNVDNADVEQNTHHGANSNFHHPFSELQQRQIENYKSGRALMINVHITHHAGTTFCAEMKKWGPTPQFACMGGDNWSNKTDIVQFKERPWINSTTAKKVDMVRQYFHMISWEFGQIPFPPLNKTNWEYDKLLSVYVTRNPMDRLLSGGGDTNRRFGTLSERNIDQWWEYTKSTHTDNFALNRLTSGTCVDGENTPEQCLEMGKALLSRFTIVLDQDCLSESMTSLAKLLDKPEPDHRRSKAYRKVPNSAAGTAQERIQYDDVYEYLLKRNKMDIALYEWSKSISLVKCESLGR